MRGRILSCLRGLLLASIIAVMAAASSGVVDVGTLMARRTLAAPAALRYPPEVFQGKVVAGSIATVGGATRFVVDRPQKTGDTFNPAVREQVNCQLEGTTATEAALVVAGAELYYEGTYDPDLRTFFVNRVSAQPLSVPLPAPPPSAPADNKSSSDNSDNSSSSDNSDNDSSDNSDNSSSSDNNSSDNSDNK